MKVYVSATILVLATFRLSDGKPQRLPFKIHPKMSLNYKSTNHENRIIGGVPANLGDFKYQVSLRWVGYDSHGCGGTILTQLHIMTAAHCISDIKFYVVAGSVDLNSGGERYEVVEYIVHEEYNPGDHWANDIAILVLASPIQFNDFVDQGPIPLFETNGGDLLTVSGWGKTDPNVDTLPNLLQKLDNYVALSTEDCRNRIGAETVHDTQICAGAEQGRGTCNGDSGGPLTQGGVVVGIVSWVFVPCGSGNPDVFTRVSRYVDWIQAKVGGGYVNQLKFI